MFSLLARRLFVAGECTASTMLVDGGRNTRATNGLRPLLRIGLCKCLSVIGFRPKMALCLRRSFRQAALASPLALKASLPLGRPKPKATSTFSRPRSLLPREHFDKKGIFRLRWGKSSPNACFLLHFLASVKKTNQATQQNDTKNQLRQHTEELRTSEFKPVPL